MDSRIIPALAGNTPASLRRASRRADHPRSRGEYEVVAGGEVVGEGSSPLSRGILIRVIAGHGRIRIIPALAGNTACTKRVMIAPSDHPRSRGEYGGRVGINWG